MSVKRNVLSPNEIESVRVFYLDYGNNEEVSLHDIMPMAKSISTKPIQAIHCSLNGIAPDWPLECIDFFKARTENGILAYLLKSEPHLSDRGNWRKYVIEAFVQPNDTNIMNELVQHWNQIKIIQQN